MAMKSSVNSIDSALAAKGRSKDKQAMQSQLHLVAFKSSHKEKMETVFRYYLRQCNLYIERTSNKELGKFFRILLN